jgi:5-bromo-4-chloroindolyl phosphate hydrolysis protein
MSLSLIVMAVAFFILILGNLILTMTCLAYVYKVHKWHVGCRRFETEQDESIHELILAQREVSSSVKGIAQRHENMVTILVNLTNEVLSLTQERSKRNSIPPNL